MSFIDKPEEYKDFSTFSAKCIVTLPELFTETAQLRLQYILGLEGLTLNEVEQIKLAQNLVTRGLVRKLYVPFTHCCFTRSDCPFL